MENLKSEQSLALKSKCATSGSADLQVRFKSSGPVGPRSQCNQTGASMVEYALLLALLALIAVPAIRTFGDKLGESFCNSAAKVGDLTTLVWEDGECKPAGVGI